MSTSKKQSLIITAIALIIIGIIMAVFALSQPKVYVDDSSASAVVSDRATDYSEPAADASVQEAEIPINLNTCTYDELLAVDGIGAARASAIIEYRDVIGSYTSVDEIKNISGIGESLFEKISPNLCV